MEFINIHLVQTTSFGMQGAGLGKFYFLYRVYVKIIHNNTLHCFLETPINQDRTYISYFWLV